MSRRRPQSESGYILLAVLFMVVLILIGLSVAAPRIASDIRRDREDELMHRGLQYKRAIKLYNKRFGSYPSSINQLESSNNLRFLRKRYVDPMTGKDDWKIIHLGEAHVKPMGLFGQPLQSTSSIAAATGTGVPGATVGTPSTFGGTTPLGGSTTTTGSPYSGSSPSTTTGTGTDSSGSSSTPGTTTSGTSSTSSSPFSSTTGSSGFGSGQTFGGAPMVGVVSKNAQASIKEYKKQKHYSEWEFVYDPVEDLLSAVSLLGGGGGQTNGTTPGTSNTGTGFPGSNSGLPGSSSGFPGSSNPGSSSPFGSNPGSGSGMPSNPPTSPQPQ